MQVKVTLTLKEEELKKIMDETGLTKPDEIKGYFYARELRNVKCEFGNRYDIDVKVDDMFDGLRRRLDGTAAQLYIYDELFNRKPKKPEVKEVKRQAKVGEWIKITDAQYSYDLYKNGDILQVYKTSSFSDRMYFSINGVFCELPRRLSQKECKDISNDNGNVIIRHYEYVVLENYEPEEGEKK